MVISYLSGKKDDQGWGGDLFLMWFYWLAVDQGDKSKLQCLQSAFRSTDNKMQLYTKHFELKMNAGYNYSLFSRVFACT